MINCEVHIPSVIALSAILNASKIVEGFYRRKFRPNQSSSENATIGPLAGIEPAAWRFRGAAL